MPLFGPTSARDFVGNLADGAAEPIPEPWSQVDDSGTRLGLRVLEKINELPDAMELYDSMSRSSIDKYAAVRDAYAQLRAKAVEE
jgi:phospholipid-binding lipoprotein MlaA